MNKKGDWRAGCVVMEYAVTGCAIILCTFSGLLYGMTTGQYIISQKSDSARKQAEQEATLSGKTDSEVRDAGRIAAQEEMVKAQAEWAQQEESGQSKNRARRKKNNAAAQSRALAEDKKNKNKENKENKEEKKEEEKEPEKKAPVTVRDSEQKQPVQPEPVLSLREEHNWAARYKDQTEQSFRVPARFDNKPVLHFGDYRVAWDEEHRRNRVLLCEDDPRSCTLETEDTIYIYELQGDYWVMSNSLDK